MDKDQALNNFWNSFGVKAYDINTVPDNAPIKKITYEVSISDFGESVPNVVYIHDRSNSWKSVVDIQNLIDARLKNGGATIPFDNGIIWITKASPFAMRLDGENDSIRRIAINVQAEYLEV